MPKSRHLAKVIPVDFRSHSIIKANLSRSVGYSKTRRKEDQEAALLYFREECKRLSSELVLALRENIALRKTNEVYALRIVTLEHQNQAALSNTD